MVLMRSRIDGLIIDYSRWHLFGNPGKRIDHVNDNK